MKKIKIYLFTAILFITAPFGFSQNPVEVEFEVSGENLDSVYTTIDDFKLTLGLHSQATNGPSLDEFDIPGTPPSLFVTFKDTVFFVGNETPLIEEYKNLDQNSAIWQLRLEFGDPSQTGATNGNINLSWEGDGGSNPFNDAAFMDYSTIQLVILRDILQGPIDMRSVTSHTFSPAQPNSVQEDIYIVLSKEVNTPPVARDDSTAALVGETIPINVLGNDTDVDDGNNENLIVTSVSSANATIPANQKTIDYSRSDAAIETFTYTISDGTDETTASVTVTVDDVVFIRSHDLTANTSEGLVVTVEVKYASSVAAEKHYSY